MLVALEDATPRFGIPLGALGELIEGVRMDVLETRYETFEELVGYCRRVAGAIGRVCLSIFGSRPPARGAVTAGELADDLGVALQLTNILRDVREDAENGRVYLPGRGPAALRVSDRTRTPRLARRSRRRRSSTAVWLAWCASRPTAPSGGSSAGCSSCRCWTAAARACVRAMAGIYHRLLVRIESEPERVLRERVSLSGPREGVGRGPRAGRGDIVSATRVVVVGGGLAGIAAALELADAGAEVTLVEVRPRLGGAAYSVSREGLEMDNGQHVFLRCCTAYRGLLERLGSTRR